MTGSLLYTRFRTTPSHQIHHESQVYLSGSSPARIPELVIREDEMVEENGKSGSRDAVIKGIRTFVVRYGHACGEGFDKRC